jgi:hypothetical protein
VSFRAGCAGRNDPIGRQAREANSGSGRSASQNETLGRAGFTDLTAETSALSGGGASFGHCEALVQAPDSLCSTNRRTIGSPGIEWLESNPQRWVRLRCRQYDPYFLKISPLRWFELNPL